MRLLTFRKQIKQLVFSRVDAYKFLSLGVKLVHGLGGRELAIAIILLKFVDVQELLD
jgi:hypothetical protein